MSASGIRWRSCPDAPDILRAAKRVGLKAKPVREQRFSSGKVIPTPCIAVLTEGGFAVFAGKTEENSYRLVDPVSFISRTVPLEELLSLTSGNFILLQRGFSDVSAFQRRFGFAWFLPSLWRYRSALAHVFLASLFLQLFALVSPLFFQVVVDKVLAHRSYSTLTVLIIGLAAIGLFDVVLQYLRTYALTHTTNLITTLTERVSMRSGLLERAAGRKSDVLDATQALREEEATLSTYAGQLLEAQASLAVAETEKNKVMSTFVADNIQKTGDLARQMDEAQQELVKAEKRLAATLIYAPSDGVIQASSITTTGQVVSAETEIMRIIPANLPLEIEVFFANQDVGFVKPHQPAVIKVETFPFTRYGVLTGTVKTVARDAIPNPDAQAMEEQAAPQFRSVVPGGNVQRLQNLVYPATIALDTTEINVDGVMRPLSPGMAVSVEIKTGTRRIIDYFWSPVAQVASEAMQER
ncbi:hypothetical protein BS627_23635 [Agrobacterium salinitolerans]|nr:hypothetical protein BS627_23635 [Agrobacterium salinitolerans]